MVRKPSLEIINYLKVANYDEPAVRYVLCKFRTNIIFKIELILINACFTLRRGNWNWKINVPSSRASLWKKCWIPTSARSMGYVQFFLKSNIYSHSSHYLLIVPNWFRKFKEVVPSVLHPNKYDLPFESVEWLKHFSSQNSELLKELDVSFIFYVKLVSVK